MAFLIEERENFDNIDAAPRIKLDYDTPHTIVAWT